MNDVPELPPYARALGITVTQIGEHGPVLELPFVQNVMGRPGMVHGGALSGLLEMAVVTALSRALGHHIGLSRFKPINITVDFMRGAGSAATFAEGRVLRLGRNLANVEATAWQETRDRPVATAQAHFLMRAPTV